MDGTIALWYEPLEDQGVNKKTISSLWTISENLKNKNPEIRVHINLWRDIKSDFNFIDFGLLFTDVSQIGKVFLYIPSSVEKEEVFDLGHVLKDSSTRNVVFNDIFHIKRNYDDCFFIEDINNDNRKLVHEMRSSDLNLEKIKLNSGGVNSFGSIISISDSFFDNIRKKYKYVFGKKIDNYVRFRIVLSGKSKNIFTTDDKFSDDGFSILQNVTETTEFRFNERRSYPEDVLDRTKSGSFDIRSIHYFLIRDKKYQIKSQHQNFKKIRYLEDNAWDYYSSVGRNSKSKVHINNQKMMIYQWREYIPDGQMGIESFIAYASFEVTSAKIKSYLIVMLVVGGCGSALANLLLSIINFVFSEKKGVWQDSWGLICFLVGQEASGESVPVIIETHDYVRDQWQTYSRSLIACLIFLVVAFSPLILNKWKKVSFKSIVSSMYKKFISRKQ